MDLALELVHVVLGTVEVVCELLVDVEKVLVPQLEVAQLIVLRRQQPLELLYSYGPI